jgi:hypothetical protein
MRYKNTESISLIVRCEIRCRDIIKASPWLRRKGLDWAADLLTPEPARAQDTVASSLEIVS